MIERRGRTALLAVPAAFLLAACASSGALQGAGTVGSAGAGSGSSTATTGGSRETLAAQLHEGVSKVRTAHFALQAAAAGEGLSGSGDEQLTNGKLAAMALTETLPGGTGDLSIVLVAGKTYVKLPASLNKSPKPWTLATTESPNPVVRSLAQNLGNTVSSASVSSVGAFVDAAKSIKTVGTETINGAPATRLHIVVDVKKLVANQPKSSGEALERAGLTELPVDMWLDGDHRPVQIVEEFAVGSQQVSTKVTLSRYNEPVTIAAPPASQVGR